MQTPSTDCWHLSAGCGASRSGAAVLAGAPGPAPSAEPWTPVLAIGSNAGPEQLARKFPPEMFPAGVVVPAVRAVLEDFDVVYAPLISSYGSCTGAARGACSPRTLRHHLVTLHACSTSGPFTAAAPVFRPAAPRQPCARAAVHGSPVAACA